MTLFVNSTKRSAGELLADLSACRQFRHLDDAKRQEAVSRTYVWMAECWMGPKAVKHPDPSKPCVSCGTPRSKYSGTGAGKCFRCYALESESARDLWVEDVFAMAAEHFGFTCDGCDEIAHTEATRIVAVRALENFDGAVKPVLCPRCDKDFKSFASRNFGRGAWRTTYYRDGEKMALAWFAQKVKRLAERVKQGETQQDRPGDRAGGSSERSPLVKLNEIAL